MRLLRKLFMIIAVLIVAYYTYNHYGGSQFLASKNPAVKKQADNVLGATNGILAKSASSSADFVSGMVLQKATEPLMREYHKLRPPQKEIIKKQICK